MPAMYTPFSTPNISDNDLASSVCHSFWAFDITRRQLAPTLMSLPWHPGEVGNLIFLFGIVTCKKNLEFRKL